jgi:hypothetical protein
MKQPTPGRPGSLGRSVDLDDANAVLSIAAACRKTLRPDRPRSGPVRVLREDLWFIWEKPRLPPPLVASKYPRSYPWSPGARAVFAEHAGNRPKGGWVLVIEHLYPRELLVVDLLEDAEGVKTAGSVDVLTERLIAAVVTRDDDRQLPTRAQSAHPWDDYAADPWLRYRSAGLQLEDFAPLA